jgi:hypothetical protein|tara:strand:- start:140 stop:454 length:315 start_codon:yes stop_codon:yes gene_type:complete
MNKQVAKELKIFTDVVCERYSKKDRTNNFNNETFEVQEIIPTSDHTATVIYEKNTGKRAAFFFYYIASFKKWNYYVPTDSHINGMSAFANQKIEVERHNYKYNF